MLITNATVITWGKPNEILEDHAVLIADGRISELGPTADLLARHPNSERIDAQGQFVMPGNINTHGHFYGAFARGISTPGAQPFNLPTILQKLWWPFDRALNEEDTRYSTLVGLIDAIKNGTTTLFDHQSSPNFIDGSLDLIAEEVDRAGMRSILCFEVTDRDGEERANAGIAENVRFYNRCASSDVAGGRVAANIGAHACMSITEESFAKMREATPSDAGFHIHVAEHEYDEYRSMEMTGTRSVDRLLNHEMLNDKTIVAHAVHLDAGEVELLVETGANVSHQPRSNMNTGTGIAELESYSRAGVSTCIGTDGLGNAMWKEWEIACLVPKVKHRDSRRMGPDQVIESGVYGAAALASRYYPAAVGVIEPGAYADLIFVDYHPTTPMTTDNLAGHIIFGFDESMVTTTIVNGEVLMRDRQLLTLDEEEITAKSRELAADFWKRYEELVPPDPVLG
ncbi:MAG: putative aminohydrolase SsnA [Acidimicrobiia bacterium]|nr:putative aminohydrolase SsnA [Acidimicrobiia bacterium]